MKYASIYLIEDGGLRVHRGKKDAEISGFVRTDDEEDGPEFESFHSERKAVVTLPETMSPTEYDAYMNGYPEEIIDAVRDVAEENGVDLPDDWPECAYGQPGETA